MSEEETENSDSNESSMSRDGNIIEKVLGGILAMPQELERRVEDGIQRTLSLLDIPSRDEVRMLHQRLDRLLDRCERILDQRQESGKKEKAESVNHDEDNTDEAV